jgi:hypothetical protein
MTPPRPTKPFMPPTPVPTDVRGARSDIRLVINSQGRPFADSVTVCGIKNRRYSRQVAAVVAQWEFEPAQRDGRAVAAPYRLLFEF